MNPTRKAQVVLENTLTKSSMLPVTGMVSFLLKTCLYFDQNQFLSGRLAPGSYAQICLHRGGEGLMRLRGDRTYVDLYVTVLPPRTQAVANSITTGRSRRSVSVMDRDPEERAGAVDVVRQGPRREYQAPSQDPNTLSNFDQDLPNNLNSFFHCNQLYYLINCFCLYADDPPSDNQIPSARVAVVRDVVRRRVEAQGQDDRFVQQSANERSQIRRRRAHRGRVGRLRHENRDGPGETRPEPNGTAKRSFRALKYCQCLDLYYHEVSLPV